MSCLREKKSDFFLVLGGALLINLLIVALIPMLFKSAGRRQAAPVPITPPVFLVPAPPEAAPETAPAAPAEPEETPPPPLEIKPEPLPLPKINPQIKLSEIKINPQVETTLKLDHLPRPEAAPAPASAAVSRPAPVSRGFYRVGELDRKPLGMARMQPPYPFRARRRGIEGKVKIRFYITPSGRVEGVRVVKAEPPGYFEKSVLDTVARWRFKPGMVGGRAVKTLVETTIVFKLDR